MASKREKSNDGQQRVLPLVSITIGDAGPEEQHYFDYGKKGKIRIPVSFDPKNLSDPCWGMSYGPMGNQTAIVGRTEMMLTIFRLVLKLAYRKATLLFEGESGTGKQVLAQAAGVMTKKFKTLNCAGLSDSLLDSELFGHVKGGFTGSTYNRLGLFRAADGGTVFLDEVGDMGQYIQAKLLRVLQEGLVKPVGSDEEHRVDVRVIAATNRDLFSLVKRGSFREDLYYRISVVKQSLPPLRDKKADIPLLLVYFVLKHRSPNERMVTEIPKETLEKLCAYDWPGNVRQLENRIKRALSIGDGHVLQPEEFTLTETKIIPLHQTNNTASSSRDRNPTMGKRFEEFRKILDENPGLRTIQLARIAGCSQRTVQRRLEDFENSVTPQKNPSDRRNICYSFNTEQPQSN